jgi:EAL domain-containing protein (putative c-di-GMP-specific phosphodiesterase class I)
MVQGITDIGKSMGLGVVAEFVENEETLTVLRSIGVDFGQGYGIGKPEPLRNTIEDICAGRRSHSA